MPNDNLNEITGGEWLENFLKFLDKSPSKPDLVTNLGTPQNPLEADLLNLKPSNSHIQSIDLLSEGDKVKKITINLEKDFGLTEEQLMKMYPDTEPSQNTSDMRNELEIRPPQKYIARILASAPLNTDFNTPINTIIIELN